MSTKVINCGELTIQTQYRLALTKILKAHGLKPGNRVVVKIEIETGVENK